MPLDDFPRKPMILVVDDIPKNLQVVGKLLDKAGYSLSFASDYKKALEILDSAIPDLILLDVMMPEMDGFELCELIKRNAATKDIPVIFLTARISTDDIVRGFQAGAVDYIMKPFNVKELLIRIKTHLELKFSKEIINQKAIEIENVNKELTKINIEKDRYLNIIHKELRSAADYVLSLLPSPIKCGDIISDWVFVPSRSLGGDAFGYKQIDDSKFAFYLLDVCGHGVRSALHSVSIINTINFEIMPNMEYLDPAKALSELNNRFQMAEHNDLFFSIIYCVYDRNTRVLKYSGGGHPPALSIDKSGEKILLKSTNRIMGFLPNTEFHSDTIQIGESSDIYLYSDGVYEYKSKDGKRGDYEDLFEYIVENRGLTEHELQCIYKNSLNKNSSTALSDDFSILKIHID
jgi:sigma-B regulation protein RsbU (phosphoserine phosphatase)